MGVPDSKINGLGSDAECGAQRWTLDGAHNPGQVESGFGVVPPMGYQRPEHRNAEARIVTTAKPPRNLTPGTCQRLHREMLEACQASAARHGLVVEAPEIAGVDLRWGFDVAFRVAQFVEDKGFQGVPILFTWASAARTSRFVDDLNCVLVARYKVQDVVSVRERTGAEIVVLFAQSKGTFLAMEGLVDGAQTGRLDRRGTRIKQIILASPDIDLDLFRAQLGELPSAIREKMYLLLSKDDGALEAWRWIAGGVPRVGAADAQAFEKLGVAVIDLSEIDDSSSGSHTKFAGSPEVV